MFFRDESRRYAGNCNGNCNGNCGCNDSYNDNDSCNGNGERTHDQIQG